MSAVRAGSIRANVTVTWTQGLREDALDEQMLYLEHRIKQLVERHLGLSPNVTVKPFRPSVET